MKFEFYKNLLVICQKMQKNLCKTAEMCKKRGFRFQKAAFVLLFVLLVFLLMSGMFLFVPLPKQTLTFTLMEDNFDDNSLDPSWRKDVSTQGNTKVIEVNGELQIYAKGNTFAHIERNNMEDNIRAQIKIKISDINTGESHSPGLTLYWSQGNWTRISLVWSGRNKFLITNMIDGKVTNIYVGGVIHFNTYYWVAIELTPTLIKTYKSDDGTTWVLLNSRSRPRQFAGAPTLIILGKGYGTGVSPYSNPDLDNDASIPSTFSYTYIDDFKVTKDGQIVSLRKFPYPYKAGLTIASDIDGCSREEFLKIRQFLNTKQNTSDMGIGVGLEIGDSFWMYTRHDVDPNLHGQFSYFINNTTVKSNDADLIRTFVHAGYLDTLHTFGAFDKVGGFTRQMALDALAEMRKAQIAPKVYINHGDSNNHQNIGNYWYNYKRGDLPTSTEYHTDLSLYPNGPIRFLWKSDLTNEVGYNPLSTVTLADGRKIHVFTRYFGPGWHVNHLARQLSKNNLDALIASEKYMIVANHMGFTTGGIDTVPPFDAETRAALRDLAQRYENGDIYVTTTSKLLWYNFIHDNLKWNFTGDCNSGIIINIINITDTAFGDFVPIIEDLQGITFYTFCPTKTSIILNSTNITSQMQINPSDYLGRQSISFPLVKLPPLPEWTSTGYTRKTENYNITEYNYVFNVTNIGDTAFIPILNYIGLHDFDIREAKIGSVYYIYIPDGKTVHLPRLQPGETISGLHVLNGAYNPTIPRLTNNSNSNISVVNATYNAITTKTSLTLEGIGLTNLSIKQLNKPFLNATTIIDSNSNLNVLVNISGEMSIENVNMNVIPSTGSVGIIIDTWNTSGTCYKKWIGSTANVYITTTYTIGDLIDGQYYQVKVDGGVIKISQANRSGQISFTYSGSYSDKIFEVEELQKLNSSQLI